MKRRMKTGVVVRSSIGEAASFSGETRGISRITEFDHGSPDETPLFSRLRRTIEFSLFPNALSAEQRPTRDDRHEACRKQRYVWDPDPAMHACASAADLAGLDWPPVRLGGYKRIGTEGPCPRLP